MTISLEHLYLDFAPPRRLLGLCHAGKELVTKPLKRLYFARSEVLKGVFALDRGNTGGYSTNIWV